MRKAVVAAQCMLGIALSTMFPHVTLSQDAKKTLASRAKRKAASADIRAQNQMARNAAVAKGHSMASGMITNARDNSIQGQNNINAMQGLPPVGMTSSQIRDQQMLSIMGSRGISSSSSSSSSNKSSSTTTPKKTYQCKDCSRIVISPVYPGSCTRCAGSMQEVK